MGRDQTKELLLTITPAGTGRPHGIRQDSDLTRAAFPSTKSREPQTAKPTMTGSVMEFPTAWPCRYEAEAQSLGLMGCRRVPIYEASPPPAAEPPASVTELINEGTWHCVVLLLTCDTFHIFRSLSHFLLKKMPVINR
ncbi:uncharacterized [Tachysurus ichikawai]